MEESVEHFNCAHLGADTAMLFIYSVIRAEDIVTPVLVDSEDADVVVICAYSSSILPGDLYLRRKKVKFLCSAKMAKIVIQLYM